MNKKTVRDIEVKGKKVLVRCDFNVPQDENGVITDNRRIVSALDTIKYLLENNAKVILCSHLGRPKGEFKKEFSLAPIAAELSKLLGKEVKLAKDVIGEDAQALVDNIAEGEVVLLENVRFHREETDNEPEFAKKLASFAEVFVNDAFGTAHRAHASTAGVADYLPAVSGFLIEKELNFMGDALNNPERPFMAILGGRKVSDKIGVIEALLEKVDTLMIGGAMAYTFFKAMGYGVGDSICELDKLDLAKELMEKAKQKGVKLMLPVDTRIGKEFKADTESKVVAYTEIPDGWEGFDIGDETIKMYVEELSKAKTVVWNGPVGLFEFDQFAVGTNSIAKALADIDSVKIIGGGDSAAAVEKAGLRVVNLTLEPIAAIQVAIPEKFRLLNIALVDVGAGTSDISITKGGSIIAYGMIPMAGDILTEELVGLHLVDFATAEQIKMDATLKKKTINYKDIMGLTQRTTPEEIQQELHSLVESMTKQVADKIKELNGGKSVSAVFVVGGGGKVEGYTDCLANHLGIPSERVALRGEEVLGFVRFLQEDIKKDPMLVTPIGICLNYYEDKNNFIFVTVNGESVKLYDNNRLTVMDAALQNGFPNEKLFPQRGKELNFTLNGTKRMVRGEAGEAAEITVNGKPAAVNSSIEPNARIEIKPSTMGKPASYEVRQLPEYRSTIKFIVNKKQITCPKFIEANGELVSEYYNIQEGDELKLLSYYTLEMLLEFMDLPFTNNIYVNNRKASRQEKVYENFTVEWSLEPETFQEDMAELEELTEEILEEKPVEQEKEVVVTPAPKPVMEVRLIVNGKPVVLRGKSSYLFVDILDFYPFDVSVAHGETVVMQINGEKAEFTTKVNTGDIIDLYWK